MKNVAKNKRRKKSKMATTSSDNTSNSGSNNGQPPPGSNPSSSSSSSTTAATTTTTTTMNTINPLFQNSPSSSLVLVVNSLPSTDDELNDKILETAEKLRSQTNNSSTNGSTISTTKSGNSDGHVPVINFPSSTESKCDKPTTSTSSNPTKQKVLQCVVSHKHVAVLMDDNRICRFPFKIATDKINPNSQTEPTASSSKKSNYPQPITSSAAAAAAASAAAATVAATVNAPGSSSPRSIPSRRRLVRRGGRSAASVIMSRSQIVQNTHVPEELINQAQNVLQGKSRNVIMRELQRTNLDVNSAVNNLLSRDDEDFDDGDDAADHLIGSDDLISLLDSGFHNDHSVIIDPDFSEEVFPYQIRIRGSNYFPSTSTSASGSGQNGTSSSNNNVASNNPAPVGRPVRLRDEAYLLDRDLSAGSQKRWYSVSDAVKTLDVNVSGRSKKKCDPLQLPPISFTDQREYWTGYNDRKFVQIASMHSELIAVNNTGRLCQWRWKDPEPFKGSTFEGMNYYHPRAPSLGLVAEKTSLLAASVIRATVVTETNKIATWIDDSVSMVAWKLEHTAANAIFSETISSICTGPLKITALYVSSLMSCVQLSTGALYWWGTPPFAHRKKMLEKGQNEKSKSKSKSTSASASGSGLSKENEIVQGTLVCMRNSPLYQCGAMGFTTVGSVPKIGQLIQSAWKITDTCSFRVMTAQEIHSKISAIAASIANNGSGGSTSNVSLSKNLERSEMPPPPSPASSTNSESSNTNAPTGKRGRNRNSKSSQQQASNLSSSAEDKNIGRIETWNLCDVVFTEDIKNMPIGRVIKVDGNYCAVKFNPLSSVEKSDPPSNPSNSAGNKNNDQHSSLSPTATSAAAATATTASNASSIRVGAAASSAAAAAAAVSSVDDGLIESYIQDCRLLRKEDLLAIRTYPATLTSATSTYNTVLIGNKLYDHFQPTPKRIPIPEHMQILAITLTNLGLHVIAKIGGYRLSYLRINVVSGRIEHDNKLSMEYSTFFGNGADPKSSLIRLFSAGENEQTTVVLCRDGNGTLYPLAKDCTNTVIREPISLNMGPISSIGLGILSLADMNGDGMNSSTTSSSSSSSQQAKTHAAIMALVLERQYLMPAILNSDLDLVRECLAMLNTYPDEFHSMINEICDGNHNILHIAVSACFPSSNKPPTTNSNDSVQIHLQVVDEDDLDRSTNMVNDSNENSSDIAHQPAYADNTEPLLDPMEQNPIAHSILWTLMDSPALSRHLFDLLTARDYQGLTPFMLAISGRAYSAAQQIFVVIQRVARMIACNSSDSSDLYQRAFLQMLYPRGSSPDHSPLYMLCSNDTCSFTWTGEEHINQDIFECRTCGLVGSLCCCTECARVCHRGHDCKLKKTSPTAYCDCWEKCKCKALVAGSQSARYNLLKRLLATTDLSTRVNSRGEHILLFLVQTVGRQITEQKQYRPTRLRPFNNVSSGSRGTKNEPIIDETSLPEHDLEPPKFARRVLEKLLGDWITVKSMILTGYRSSENTAQQRRRPYLWNLNATANTYLYEEENSYLSCQNGSALLDKFTHSLLKLNLNDAVERITGTIVVACYKPSTAQEAKIVARRFVRSVIRVSSMILFETNPIHYSMSYFPFNLNVPIASYIDLYISSITMPGTSLSSLSKKSNAANILKKIRRVFLVLLPIACEELCEIAESLIAPVRLGLCLPSNPFVMTPSNGSSSTSNDSGGNLTDELFSVDTSVYSHQRDFLDPTLSLHEMMDEPSAQESLPPSSHLLWNAYESSSSAADVLSSASRNNDENSAGQQQQSAQQPRQREEVRNGILPNNNNDNSNVSNDVEMSLSADLPTNAPSNSMVYDLSQSNDSTTTQSTVTASSNPVAASTSGQVNNNNDPSEIIIMRINESENAAAENVDHAMSSATDHDDIVMAMMAVHSLPDDYSNVGGRDTESDSESNPDDASYLSNADNASAQRSVVTGATAGSDVGVASLPYDDESLNSNPDDVDDDDDDEPDVEPDDDDSSDSSEFSDTPETEPENDVLSNFISHTVDRRTNSGNTNSSSTRHNLMQHVQWALRGQRDAILSSTGSNVQESSLRRSGAGGGGGGGVSSALVSMDNVVQIPNTMVGLSRSFSIIVRHIADLMVIVKEAQVEMPAMDFAHLTITPTEAKQLIQTMEERLRLTWNWLINCMDSTETQLRFGCALSNRRLAPTSSSTISNSGSSASNQANTSTNSTDSTTNLINSLVNPNPRLSRLRTFQSQDEMAMLPTFNRTNLRRNNFGQYLFARTSGTAGSISTASVVGSNSTSSSGGAGAGGSSGNTGNTGGSGGGGGGGGSNSNNATLNETNMTSHRDFLNYAMSLMRAHSNEHYDSLPMLDVGSHKHVAYIFDAFVYFMRRGISTDSKLDILIKTVSERLTSANIAGENNNHSSGTNTSSSNISGKEESNGRNHVFFRRSNSTLYLGCPRPDPFSAPYHEALPLANKPHLLQPNARREQLFGIPRPSNDLEAEEMLEQLPSQMSLVRRQQWNYVRMPASPTGVNSLSANPQSSPTPTRSQSVITESPSSAISSRGSIIPQQQPNKLSVIVMAGSAKHQQQQQVPGGANHISTDHNYGSKSSGISRLSTNVGDHKVNYFGNVHQQDLLLGRWRLTLELFGRLFVEDVSLEPNSIIQELSGFPIKESKFRREMERLRISCSSSSATQRDLNFYKLDRDRNALLTQTFKELNSVFSSVTRRLTSQTSLASQPLTITRVKVTFKDEPGEGTGVARSFYTAFSEAVLTNEKLPAELLINYGINRHSLGQGPESRETYSSFMYRLRSSNSNNNPPATRSRVSSSGPPLSTNIDGSSISLSSTSLRRPRSPARHRPFYSNTFSRRTISVERARNVHDTRSSTTLANGASNEQQNNSETSSLQRRHGTTLRYDAPPFAPTQRTILTTDGRSNLTFVYADDHRQPPPIGLRIFNRVMDRYPAHATKITGMLLDLNEDLLNMIVNNNDDLRGFMDRAMDLIQLHEGGGGGGSSSSSSSSSMMPLNASSFDLSGNGGGNGNDLTTAATTTAATTTPTTTTSSSSSLQQYPAQQPISSSSSSNQVASQVLPFLTASALEYEAIYAGTKAYLKTASAESSTAPAQTEFQDEDDTPMFYQPGTRGFYCPRAGRGSENRLNAFRNVGRIIGVCFVQNELCPITFNRHVIKMILGQPVAWHDLAFFDSELYESLRQLILDAESNNKEEIFSECDFRFAIDLPPEEGGQEIELVPNGRNIRVTPQNVYDYVRKYAQFRMVDSQEKAIMAIRAGIFDVIPSNSFDGLTPEDFRLLLNGVNEINVQQLQTYVTFYDESGDPDPMNNFQKWFWWVVDRMTNEEKQDLIYFWTGSPALPASEEGFQPKPSITVRPRDDFYFVTANTCISRLYIPLYSSRNILRQKLLMSIKSKSFGFI